MDPISLLAELHGDGREMVQKLRKNGLNSLEDICAKEPAELARLLKMSVRLTRKIHLEAQEMLQGKLFEPMGRLVQPPKKSAVKRPVESTDLIASNFKAQVVDLVAKYFR